MLGRLGPLELLVILSICVLIFGPRQIPKLGHSLGETIRAFRGAAKELRGAQDEVQDVVDDTKRAVREIDPRL